MYSTHETYTYIQCIYTYMYMYIVCFNNHSLYTVHELSNTHVLYIVALKTEVRTQSQSSINCIISDTECIIYTGIYLHVHVLCKSETKMYMYMYMYTSTCIYLLYMYLYMYTVKYRMYMHVSVMTIRPIRIPTR